MTNNENKEYVVYNGMVMTREEYKELRQAEKDNG